MMDYEDRAKFMELPPRQPGDFLGQNASINAMRRYADLALELYGEVRDGNVPERWEVVLWEMGKQWLVVGESYKDMQAYLGQMVRKHGHLDPEPK